MKNSMLRTLAALALATTLAASIPAVSYGASHDVTTTTLAHPYQAYRLALRAYLEARTSIAVAYKSAVQSAKAVCAAALSVATTAAERSAARAALKLAIVQASGVRQVALIQLGNPPTRP